MPELPDVEHFRLVIQATSLHKRIASVSIRRKEILDGVSAPRLKKTLQGNRFEETGRHAKFLFVKLERGGWLVLHFGMTGYPKYYRDEGDEPEHARFVVDFKNGHHLALSLQRLLGRVGLTEDPAEFVEAQGLGPDAASLDLDAFRDILGCARGTIKGLFLNQSRIGGLGNVYGDEVLFQAGVHPKATPRDLDDDVVRNLHRALKRVLKKAVDVKADPEKMPRTWLTPARGAGNACPRSCGPLERISVSGRNGWWCPRCQARGKP